MDDTKLTHFIFLTKTGDSLGIAWQLQRAGCRVLVGIVDDVRNAESKDKEDSDTKRRRTSMYKDILHVMSAEKLMTKMRSFPEKEKWFVFVDFNSMWRMAQDAIKMGFTAGLFPSQLDFKLEEDRNMAKDFVEKYYPGIEVAPHMEFKTIEEGIEYINECEDFLALKSNDPEGTTTVPKDKDIDFAKQIVIETLTKKKEIFERKGFTLEKQIRDGCEVNGETIFYNGSPVLSTVDIENKEIGDENTAGYTGCMMNLIVRTDMDSELNTLSRPDAMTKMAKKHKGLFFSDLNVIYKDGKYYFLEFCGNRPGYDSFVTEMDMSNGSMNFFNKVVKGENPLEHKFGYALRGLNQETDEKHLTKEGLTMRWKPEYTEHIFPFEIQRHHAEFVTTGYGMDSVVFCSSSDDMEYAMHKTHDIADNFSLKNMYRRARHDSLSKDYPTSIRNRFEGIKSKLWCEEEEEGESDVE